MLISGFISHLEKDWEDPPCALPRTAGAIARLIRFDKRGTGLSDRAPGVPSRCGCSLGCWIGLHKWEFVLAGPKGEDVLRRCKRCGREQGSRLIDYTGGA